jgi:hypothetical protein
VNTNRKLYLVAAALILLNFADFVSTWIIISSGRGYESNPVVIYFGGPFSPLAIFVKLILIPTVTIGIVLALTRKGPAVKMGTLGLLPAVVVLAGTVANNVVVVAKKVKKTRPSRNTN